MENERVWRRRMESERVWRPRMEIQRVWKPRMESGRVWRPRIEIEREWSLRGTSMDFGLPRELWTGRAQASQASRESAGRQKWAEHLLEAVREGQVGQPGVTDFGPRGGRSSRPCAKGK